MEKETRKNCRPLAAERPGEHSLHGTRKPQRMNGLSKVKFSYILMSPFTILSFVNPPFIHRQQKTP